MKPEMSNLDVALSSFWQLARHWKQGDTAKLELSCEAGSLHLQLSAKLGHPDHIHFPQSLNSSSCKKKSPSQLRRQERRRQQALSKAANENVSQESDKNTFDNVPTSKEAEMLNETNENPKKKLTEKLVDSKLPIQSKQTSFKCDLCDYKGESNVGLRMHISRKHQDIPQLDGESFLVFLYFGLLVFFLHPHLYLVSANQNLKKLGSKSLWMQRYRSFGTSIWTPL